MTLWELDYRRNAATHWLLAWRTVRDRNAPRLVERVYREWRDAARAKADAAVLEWIAQNCKEPGHGSDECGCEMCLT